MASQANVNNCHFRKTQKTCFQSFRRPVRLLYPFVVHAITALSTSMQPVPPWKIARACTRMVWITCPHGSPGMSTSMKSYAWAA